MVAEGGAGLQRPVSLPWGIKGLKGRWTHPEVHESFGR